MSSEIVIKFLVAAVLAGTPFLFGTVGEILSEKVGHLNLGVEGMMSIAGVLPDTVTMPKAMPWTARSSAISSSVEANR